MYRHYFGLAEAPFSIAPDPRYLYLSQRHQEALAHLLYGVSGDGGFVLLTGEVGAGKTTVCRCLLQQIPPSCDVAYIFNPKLTVEELLTTICVEFGIAYPEGNSSIKVFVDRINAYLLEAHARGRHTVLIIDEAQNLSAEVLEQMRLLTNLETNERKLLQIMLIGQPELGSMLARPQLRQLSQRIVARYHLGPLTQAEVAAYVRHRLELSGARRPLFPAGLMGRVYRLSGGVPRVINVLCDRALLGAYTQSKERIDRATLAQAAREVLPPQRERDRVRPLVAILLLLVGGLLGVTLYEQELRAHKTVATPAGIAAAASGEGAAGEAEKSPSARTESPAAVADKDAGNPTVAHAGSKEVLPDTLVLPQDQARSGGKAAAYAALLRAWGVDYRGGDACRQVEGLGLRCRSARGGTDELRRLNRPAILLLRDDAGSQFHATLVALDDNGATFNVGGETRTLALGALAAQWAGHYTLLWRMPADVGENIRAGDRGAAVEWLLRQLAAAEGGAAETGRNRAFDEALVRQVKQFQLAQGLIPDGAVGPQTLIRLAGVGDRSAPKLTPEPRGQ